MMTTQMTPAVINDDAELVHACRAGNQEAFGQIVARYQSLICALAYSATGSLSQSEDLAQETFLAAWKELNGLREPTKLRAWLCGIARNLINNFLRKQGRDPSHHAESLEGIHEAHSLEPQPAEHAISKEEAEILWRALERIPETYREPLVLFYREHQSIEAVAQKLDLTEEAARQRLSRGRKLLENEVLSFVEGALAKTAPSAAFVVAVVAALPMAATTAKAAALGASVVKTGAGAKGIFSLGTVASFLSMPVAILFSVKMLMDDAKSPRERKFIRRAAMGQIGFFVFLLATTSLITLSSQPWVIGAVLAGVILAFLANATTAMPWLSKRHMEIRVEEGAFLADLPGNPDPHTKPKIFGKMIKVMMPMLIMFAGGAIALPWKHHWLRCAVLMAAETLLLLWCVRRFLRLFNGQYGPAPSRWLTFGNNPWIKLSFILGLTAIGGGGLGCLLAYFLHPEMTKGGIFSAAWMGPMGLCLLLAVLLCAAVLALLYLARRKFASPWAWLAKTFNLMFLENTQGMTKGADAVVEMTYAPLFKQLNLKPDQQGRIKELVLKRTMVGVRTGKALMQPALDAAKRAALADEMKAETGVFNALIKDFLGNENYVTLQKFEQTIPDRMMLDMIFKRPAATAGELNPEQQEQLLAALTEARNQYPWTTGLSRRTQPAGGYGSPLTEDNLRIFALEEEEFARQFLSQAKVWLNPEQLAAFEKRQTCHWQSQISQYKMAMKLWNPKSQ